MKYFICSLILFFTISANIISQNVSINTTGNPPDASAMLDVSSQTKGFLLPRMTALERTSIPFPQTGLLVFDLDLFSLFYFDGNQWVEFASTRKGLRDSDFDTKVIVEHGIDDDTIRMYAGGMEKLKIHNKGMIYESDSSNIYIGNGSNELGMENLIIGLDSTGSKLSSGSTRNTIIGHGALKKITSTFSDVNTVLGFAAGDNLNQGHRNVLIGDNSFNAQSGSENVCVGTGTGIVGIVDSDKNTFLGPFAGGSSNSQMHNNIAIGYSSGYIKDGGEKNIAIGTNAGYISSNTVYDNISIGSNAGAYLVGHDNSIFIGKNAGNSMIGCGDCILLGPNTGKPNFDSQKILLIDIESTDNPLIYGDFLSDKLGFNAKVGIQSNSPSSELHIIHENISSNSGLTLENKDNGNYWRFYTRSANGNLRLYSKEGESNSCGNNGGNDDYVAWVSACSGAWNSTSDRRKKKNFTPLNSILSSVANLNILKYNFLSEEDNEKKHIGLIAQEVQEYFPELVNYDKDVDLYTMNYNGFGPIAIKAVQEMIIENGELKKELQIHQNLLIDQQKSIDELKQELVKIQALLRAE